VAKVATAYVDIDARLDKLKAKLKAFDPDVNVDLQTGRKFRPNSRLSALTSTWTSTAPRSCRN
jgi:hypothetical protein